MKFKSGRYRGCEIADVPTAYLEWAALHGHFYDAQITKEVLRELLHRTSQEESARLPEILGSVGKDAQEALETKDED